MTATEFETLHGDITRLSAELAAMRTETNLKFAQMEAKLEAM
jgi:hypothetical protein